MYASDARHQNKSLEEKLQSIYSLRSADMAPIDLGLRPDYISLLKRLGNPHDHMPPAIHVAGTNGKGSVIAILQSILNAHGYNVHTYTSPHLIKFNERIQIAGKDISDQMLEDYLDSVLGAATDLAVTFFELTTALAFKVFADHTDKADFVLIETGLGGRLDCTNVISAPLATIITKIGFDHIEFLGETIEKIAAEKAGIMKKDALSIIGKQDNEDLYAFFKEYAITQGAQPYTSDKSFDFSALALNGQHQIENAATALTCLEALENTGHIHGLKEENIQKGLQTAHWPARLQHITKGLLTKRMPRNCDLWLDGGHNEMAGEMLARQAKEWRDENPKKELHLICSMMGHKNPLNFLKNIIPYATSICFIPIKGEEHAFEPKALQDLLTKQGHNVHTHTAEDAYSAIDMINNKYSNQKNYHILICGSLYLAGQTLAENAG